MAFTCQDVINGARRILLDPAPGVTWQDAVFIMFINQGMRAFVGLKPDTFTVREAIPMVAGPLQTLPAAGAALLDLYHNAAAPYLTVTNVSRSHMQEISRFWPGATREAVVRSFHHDQQSPTRFHVFPPNDGTGSVIGLYGAYPTPVTTASQACPLEDKYEQPLIDYCIAKAYAENTERQDLNKATAYEGKWSGFLGGIAGANEKASPKVALPRAST